MTIPTEIPNLVPKAPKPSFFSNKPLIIASALYLVIALLSLFKETYFLNDVWNFYPWQLKVWFADFFVLPILAFIAGVIGLLTRKALVLAVVSGVYMLFAAVAMVLGFSSERSLWTMVPVIDVVDGFGIAKLFVPVAFILTIVSLVVERRSAKPAFAQAQPLGAPVAPSVAPAPAAAPAPNYVAPAPGVPAMGAPSQLPIFALVAAFIVPLAGVIMGHISLNQMNKGQISSQNRTMAIAGLALGYVFMALGFLAGIILIVVILSNPYLFSSY